MEDGLRVLVQGLGRDGNVAQGWEGFHTTDGAWGWGINIGLGIWGWKTWAGQLLSTRSCTPQNEIPNTVVAVVVAFVDSGA